MDFWKKKETIIPINNSANSSRNENNNIIQRYQGEQENTSNNSEILDISSIKNEDKLKLVYTGK